MKLPSLKKKAPQDMPPENAPAVPEEKSTGSGSGSGPGGRSLWLYFLPTLLVGVLALLLVAFVTQATIRDVQQDAGEARARNAAQALAVQVASVIDARRQQLQMLANSPSLRAALAGGGDPDGLNQAAKEAGELLPDVLQLRLFAADQDIQPDPDGDAPMGYAGVDMVKRTLKGRPPGAEVHQLSSGSPYIALAQPVSGDAGVQGVLFGVWPVAVVRRVASLAPEFPGDFQLLQDNVAVLAGSGPQEPLPGQLGSEEVGGTIWSVVYNRGRETVPGGLQMVLATVAGAVLMLLLGMWLQARMLGGDLRKDMAAVVNLGESILRRSPATDASPRVSSSREALLFLGQYARESQSRPVIEDSSSPPEYTASQKKPRRAAPAAQDPASLDPAIAASAPPDSLPPQASTPSPEPAAPQRPRVSADDIPDNIFRAYDVRGIAERELQLPMVRLMGQAFASMVQKLGVGQVWMAHDARLSSPGLYRAFGDGLVEQGMQVIELGQAPVGLLYHAMHSGPGSAAVMVTGSHNPPEYNGFKLYVETKPLQGKALQVLRQAMLAGKFPQTAPGGRESRDVQAGYLNAAIDDLQLSRPLKLVVDGGNGVAGELACGMLRLLGCEVEPLFCEPDGNFPNHHPDPGDPQNLTALALEVQARQADLGLAFDGDGDRIGAVDDQGNLVRPEHLLMLLAGDILLRHPGLDVIYDVKSSRHLAGFILSNGGRPIMWRSGHTRMKEKMRETGALIGGEYSGHYFIKERWNGTDDAIYVAARLVEVIAADERPLAERLAEFPVSPSSPEHQLLLPEGEAPRLMSEIAARNAFDGAKVIDLDGLRVEFDHGWGLVRASNTVPSLTFRFEADTEPALEQIKQTFRDLVGEAAPGHQLPF